jgi:hypothetical protein
MANGTLFQRYCEPTDSAKARQAKFAGLLSRAQSSSGFLGLRGLVLTGFCELAGLMLRGRPAAGEISGSASDLKWIRHPGDSWDLFLIMQAVTRSTSGMSTPQSLNASSLQACCCSGV